MGLEKPFENTLFATFYDHGITRARAYAGRLGLLQPLVLPGGVDDRVGQRRVAPEDQGIDEAAAFFGENRIVPVDDRADTGIPFGGSGARQKGALSPRRGAPGAAPRRGRGRAGSPPGAASVAPAGTEGGAERRALT